MTASLAAANPDTLRFETTLETIDGTSVVLEDTYFYPGGGGQPVDRGTIGDATVADIHEVNGTIYHELETTPRVDVGAVVSCQIDPAFRTYCRRAHTASHILYGAGRRLFDELGYGGFDIDERKVRVDFRTSTPIADDTLVELERLTNRAVWDSRSVSWESVPRDEALSRPDVAFNTATEEGVMADADTVRLVEIEEWDVAACGGTHVANTSEVGPVTVVERSNPGEGLTRVEFSVGPPAIRHRARERRAGLAAATTLGVPVAELGEAVTDLQARYEQLADERDDLRDSVLAAELDELSTIEKGGTQWRIGAVRGFGPNEIGDQLSADSDDVVAVAGEDGSTFIVVVTDGDPDAAAIVEEITDEFGGGGGGGPTLAQGGGLSAAPEDVVEYLNSG